MRMLHKEYRAILSTRHGKKQKSVFLCLYSNDGFDDRTRVTPRHKVKHVAIDEAIDKRDAANKIVRFLKRY